MVVLGVLTEVQVSVQRRKTETRLKRLVRILEWLCDLACVPLRIIVCAQRLTKQDELRLACNCADSPRTPPVPLVPTAPPVSPPPAPPAPPAPYYARSPHAPWNADEDKVLIDALSRGDNYEDIAADRSLAGRSDVKQLRRRHFYLWRKGVADKPLTRWMPFHCQICHKDFTTAIQLRKHVRNNACWGLKFPAPNLSFMQRVLEGQ